MDAATLRGMAADRRKKMGCESRQSRALDDAAKLIDLLNAHGAETAMNGYRWMQAHDNLMGWIRTAHPGLLSQVPAAQLPTPADLPEEIMRLRNALTEISKQKLSTEMDEEERELADWEGGYDAIIVVARAAHKVDNRG